MAGLVNDPRYEFDAPQRYDFNGPSTASVGSAWFAGQGGERAV